MQTKGEKMNVSKTQEEHLDLIGYDTYYKGKKANDVIDWLREVKGLHVTTYPCGGTWDLTIYQFEFVTAKDDECIYTEFNFDTYELAVLRGITKSIEICEKEGEKA